MTTNTRTNTSGRRFLDLSCSTDSWCFKKDKEDGYRLISVWQLIYCYFLNNMQWFKTTQINIILTTISYNSNIKRIALYNDYVCHITCTSLFKAILQVLIYKALYDKSHLGSKTTMTSGEWTCLISFATAPLTCSERGGSEKFKMKIYVSSGIRTHTRQSTTGKLQRLRPLGHAG